MQKAPAVPAAGQERARALFDYTAADNTELSLTEGEVSFCIVDGRSIFSSGEKRSILES